MPFVTDLLNEIPMKPIGCAHGLEQMKKLIDKGLSTDLSHS